MLQERIKDIAEQSDLESDEGNVDEQHQINELTRVTYANKIRAHNTWRQTMTLMNDIEDLLESRKVTSTRALQAFKEITSMYKSFCADALGLCDELVTQDLMKDRQKSHYCRIFPENVGRFSFNLEELIMVVRRHRNGRTRGFHKK